MGLNAPENCPGQTRRAPCTGPDSHPRVASQHDILNVLTYKLHCVAIHLADQELQYGPMCRIVEFWVERMIQYAKRIVKGRASYEMEACFWNDECVMEGLRAWEARFPSMCWSIEKEKEVRDAQKKETRSYHDKRPSGGHMLLGVGKTQEAESRQLQSREGVDNWHIPEEEEWDIVMQELGTDVNYARQRGWPVADPKKEDDVDILSNASEVCGMHRWRHMRASLANDVAIGSRQQLVSATRNHWVYAKFQEDGFPCMLDILYFVRLEYTGTAWHAPHPYKLADGKDLPFPPQPLRYAIARVFRARQATSDQSAVTNLLPGITPELLVVDDARPGSRSMLKTLRAVMLESLDAPSPSLLMHEVQAVDPTTQVTETRGIFMRTGKAHAAWSERPIGADAQAQKTLPLADAEDNDDHDAAHDGENDE